MLSVPGEDDVTGVVVVDSFLLSFFSFSFGTPSEDAGIKLTGDVDGVGVAGGPFWLASSLVFDAEIGVSESSFFFVSFGGIFLGALGACPAFLHGGT